MSATETIKIDYLQVSNLHTLYVEQSGNLDGIPVVYLHGGPAAGSSPSTRALFDPKVYHIIQFDQRGCGKSTPHASLEQNTSWDLVDDLEIIRQHCQVDEWLVCGGSWGSTLALLYAQKYPEPVTGLILRGLFTCRKKEKDWLYIKGASELFPDYFKEFTDFIPKSQQHNLVESYYMKMTSDNKQEQIKAARAWCKWEMEILSLLKDENLYDELTDDLCLAMGSIGSYYFVNDFFLKDENQIFNDLHKIRHIPAIMVQGRYDVVTPVTTAWDIKKQWPECQLQIIADAGHTVGETGTTKAIQQAAVRFSSTSLF